MSELSQPLLLAKQVRGARESNYTVILWIVTMRFATRAERNKTTIKFGHVFKHYLCTLLTLPTAHHSVARG